MNSVERPIIYNLSNEDYHRNPPYSEYLSSTQLKAYAKSPKYAKFMLDNPQESTDAMRFGSMFHDLMALCSVHKGNLSSAFDEWERSIAVFQPPINAKTNKPFGSATNAYKDAYNAFVSTNTGKMLATNDEVTNLFKMASSLLYECGSTSLAVQYLLQRGTPEVSVFHQTEDGIKIKVRPDLLTKKKIIDWKTTTLDDLTEDSINRAILNYGYHISAAMYTWTYHEVTGEWLTFYLVFVQKQAPFDCVVVDMTNYTYRYLPDVDIVIPGPGATEFKRLLGLHTKCTIENKWDGAETFIKGERFRIMEINPPKYYLNKFIDIIEEI